jgi:hypothetical protein
MWQVPNVSPAISCQLSACSCETLVSGIAASQSSHKRWGADQSQFPMLIAYSVYATCRCFCSMDKNSATSSSSQSPPLASWRMVKAACSWLSDGLYGRAVRRASYTSTTCRTRGSRGISAFCKPSG